MCEVNQKCPQCLRAENQSREQKEVFVCQVCQANFRNGSKIN